MARPAPTRRPDVLHSTCANTTQHNTTQHNTSHHNITQYNTSTRSRARTLAVDEPSTCVVGSGALSFPPHRPVGAVFAGDEYHGDGEWDGRG